jgi:hypothetical protein
MGDRFQRRTGDRFGGESAHVNNKALKSPRILKTAHLLGQEWDKILAGQNFLSHAVQFRIYQVGQITCAYRKTFRDVAQTSASLLVAVSELDVTLSKRGRSSAG